MISNIRFTPKVSAMIKHADNIAKESGFSSIHPVHLFLSALKIDCDVNNELKLIISSDISSIIHNLDLYVAEKSSNEYMQIKVDDSTVINIFPLTEVILSEAGRIAGLYEEHGQIFVNDGHILRAIFNSDDDVIKKCLGGLNKELILAVISSPRDMLVDLDNDFSVNTMEDVTVRKVNENDKEAVREFVLKNFYERWTRTVDYGLGFDDIPICIALINNTIVGFAGYNISKQRKGYFGPLGVLKAYRDKKIGQSLLNACLIDMKKLGFKTCIIGNASSIEFYEKACGAKIISMVNS